METDFGLPTESHSRQFTPSRQAGSIAGARRGGSSQRWDGTLDGMTLQELLDLRAQIEKRLPASKLGNINLERELVLQLRAHQELQGTVLADDDTPANQRAQVASATRAALETLIKLEETVYNTTRLKHAEQALISVLNEALPEQVGAFLEKYEEALRAA